MHGCEYSMDIIGQAEVREAHVARGEAECYMILRELPASFTTDPQHKVYIYGGTYTLRASGGSRQVPWVPWNVPPFTHEHTGDQLTIASNSA